MKQTLMVLLLTLALVSGVVASPIWEIPINGNQVDKWEIIESLSDDNTLVTAVLLSPASRFRGKTTLIVYRLDEQTGVSEIWRTAYPDDRQGLFSDFAVTDLNGNGRPEICLLLNNDVVPRGTEETDWLRIFEWTGNAFPNIPTSRVSLRVDRFTRAQPVKIIPGHYTTTGFTELAVLFSGSLRKIFILSGKGGIQNKDWSLGAEMSSGTFLSEAGRLNFSVVYWDRAPLADIIFAMQNISDKSYAFTLVTLQDGKSIEKARLSTAGKSFPSQSLRFKTLKPFPDDREDLLLINEQNRGALIRNDVEKGLVFQPLEIKNPLTRVDTDGRSLLTFYRDSVRVWKKDRETKQYTYRRSQHIPFEPTQGYAYAPAQNRTFVAGTDAGNRFFMLAPLVSSSPDEEIFVAADRENMLEELKSLLDTVKITTQDIRLQKTEMGDSLVIIPPETPDTDIMTQVRNRRMTFDDVLEPGKIFSRTVALNQLDPGSLNLEWIAPEGAVYNLRTGLITWKIMPEQLDSHTIYLSISDKKDTSRTIWSVYVNDPVKIVNKEWLLTTPVNKTLSFQVELRDNNSNPEFQFELEGLEKGFITEKGVVHWTPGMENLDENIATVKVTDGFSIDSARFMIYVNDPVNIVSSPTSLILPVQKPWVYPVVVQDRNHANLYEFTFERPVIIDPEQILAKEILSVAREGEPGRYVNVRPVIEKIDYYGKNLLVTLTREKEKENITLGEILSGCLDRPVQNLPRYTVRQVKNVRYSLDNNAPAGMEISREGLLKWLPDMNQLDSHQVILTASDGLSSDEQHLHLYVNSPPKIVSDPADKILMPGDMFGYTCKVEDKNSDARIRFFIGKHSPPAHVDSLGRVVWSVSEEDYDYHQLTVIAHDGFAADSIRMMLYVNDPVRIIPPQSPVAFTDSLWTYALKYEDKNATHLYRIRVEHEDEFSQIEHQIKTFLRRQSVPVLRSSQKDTETVDVRPAVRHLYHAGPDLFVEVNPDYTGKTHLREIFAGILGKPVEYLPLHKIWRDKKVEFNLIEGPEGLTVSAVGEIRWTPKSFQFGTYPVTVRATDAIVSDTLTFQIYVNSPPHIVSVPENIVHFGDIWQYPVEIEDLNAEQEMEVRLVSAPKGVKLYPSTKTIMWSPDITQKGFWPVEIEVSDGYQTDRQSFKVFVNIPPEITSKPVLVALTGYDYSYQIRAEDLNGDRIRYKAVKMPRWAELNEQTGLITWKPRNSERGMNTFRIECIDAHQKTTIHEFDVQVFEDPSSKKFSIAIFPLMITFAGIIIVAVLL
ncbi:MAG: hypothetical protein J7K63_03535 [Candidatus Marinimicrobia bacterium]|nr:hypothetical protein [Candidatus Neomarinimicrobiota bacterium]